MLLYIGASKHLLILILWTGTLTMVKNWLI
jgi:hypothetical protein